MSFRQGIVLHCCLLLALTGCQTKPANSEQSTTTSTTNSQTASSTEQVSSQTSAPNSNTAAPGTQNSSLQNSNTTAAPGKIDACSLITRAEIETAQGEEVKDARSTAVAHSRFAISQCYYTAASPVKSVSLELTQRAPGQGGSASPREFWEERFERAGREKEKGERERERQGNGKRDADKEGGKREEEEEEGGPPVRVTGVGDEAFWVGNRIVGALYVLKDDSIIRISIGGPETESVKLEKMKALAQLAIKRLKD